MITVNNVDIDVWLDNKTHRLILFRRVRRNRNYHYRAKPNGTRICKARPIGIDKYQALLKRAKQFLGIPKNNIPSRKKKLKDLEQMRECAAISEAIERADSEHCKALEFENVAEQEAK